jgi:hypothetical protein
VLCGGPLDGYEAMLPEGIVTYKAAELDRFPIHDLVYVLQCDGHTMVFQPIVERWKTPHV